jgi:hypothetical protein
MDNEPSIDHKFVCTETNNNRRHYSNLRIAMFSVYFAVLAGIASVSFGFVDIKAGNPHAVAFFTRLGGLIFTLVFFWLEILCALNLRHYEIVLRSLPEPYRRASVAEHRLLWVWATWTMYSALVIFWAVMLIRSAA